MNRRVLLAVALVASGPAFAAEPPPNCRAAVDRGVAYLKGRYANGFPGSNGGGGLGLGEGSHELGEAALAGLALLEAGTPTTDPTVQRIAAGIRQACLPDNKTYHVALCVLFLDRLGEVADRGLIQMLGVKLYAGLTAAGGWSYQTGEPMDARLLAALSESTLQTKPKADPPPGGGGFVRPANPKDKAEPPSGLHPLAEQAFRAVKAQIASGGRRAEAGDNSNTQFGLIGLWVAARNGLPADDAFGLIEARFLRTQNRDAGWAYSGGEAGSTPAMTCAGLLGLAVGAGRHTTTPPDRRRNPGSNPGDGFVPAAPKKDKEDGPALEGVRNKRAVQAALLALAAVVRGSGNGKLGGFVGLGNEYYLLWSVERVCMAYNLADLGGHDWYQWGCDFLLPAQHPDGSWPGNGLCSQDTDTCFAILFLMRSNLVTDLSAKMGGTDRVMEAGGKADKLPPAMKAPRQEQPPKDAAPPDPLVAASDAEFAVRLNTLRDAKGAENTQAIVTAIPKLPADRQAKARAALAERLTRMTANTLRGMMKDRSDELRRAAATATGTKGDRSLSPELVDLVADPAEPVGQAARAALKALTGQDHGPPPGADAAAKSKAQEAWRAAVK